MRCRRPGKVFPLPTCFNLSRIQSIYLVSCPLIWWWWLTSLYTDKKFMFSCNEEPETAREKHYFIAYTFRWAIWVIRRGGFFSVDVARRLLVVILVADEDEPNLSNCLNQFNIGSRVCDWIHFDLIHLRWIRKICKSQWRFQSFSLEGLRKFYYFFFWKI